uniref:Uncharacterized protein n=1 Tax=Panagrolaimus davidi TaxID=227884 RepID=A0A914PW33_9BILA
MSRLFYFLTLFIPVLIAIYYIQSNTYVPLPKSNFLGPLQLGSPKNSTNFGRFSKPLEIIDFSWVTSSEFFNFTSLKFWDFKSVTTQKYFIAVAIANLNYISTAFVYVIDKSDKSQSKIFQYSSKSFFAHAIKEQTFSSVENGCTKFFQSSDEWLWICFNKEKQMYEINGTVVTEKNQKLQFNFEIDYSIEIHPSMALIYPVKVNQPVYTHKTAGLPASGKLRIGNAEEEKLLEGLGAMDWTFGYPERICQWKW